MPDVPRHLPFVFKIEIGSNNEFFIWSITIEVCNEWGGQDVWVNKDCQPICGQTGWAQTRLVSGPNSVVTIATAFVWHLFLVLWGKMIQLSYALIEEFILKCFPWFPEIKAHQSEMLQIRNSLSNHLNCWTCNLDMCFLGRGSHITRGMYFPVSQVGAHMSVGICVSKVGNTYQERYVFPR